MKASEPVALLTSSIGRGQVTPEAPAAAPARAPSLKPAVEISLLPASQPVPTGDAASATPIAASSELPAAQPAPAPVPAPPSRAASLAQFTPAPAAAPEPTPEPTPFVSAEIQAATAVAAPAEAIAPSVPAVSSVISPSTPSGSVAPAPERPSVTPAPAKTATFKLPVSGKDVATAVSQAGKDYAQGAKEATAIMKLLAKLPRNKGKDTLTLTVDQIALVIFFVILGFQLLLLPIFMPGIFRLVWNLLTGLTIGLGLSFMYYYNKKKKAETNALLALNLGLKGVQQVVGGLPSWYGISEKEKLEWLNSLVAEVWPFVDKGACKMIKDITAQVMPGVLKSLPAGLSKAVKSIGFKHLTFGAAPVRVETLWVSPEDKGRLVMEVDVKWCGDPNITLAIELPTGQKVCPRVMDITFVATIRLVLSPLVDRVPGFVAAMATVPRAPLIKYRLDFGKALGGSVIPAAVTPVVNFIIRDQVTKMLVWPQRVVVPILQATPDDVTEYQRLMRRNTGVLRVCVANAKELKAADTIGTNDVVVELTTDNEHKEATSTKRARVPLNGKGKPGSRNAQRVTWNEYLYLLVQEPKDQTMRLECFDIDLVRPGKLNGRQLMGRQSIKLAEACANPGQDFLRYYHIGGGDWGSPGGPGKGEGKVRLKLMYRPFEDLTQADVTSSLKGILTVRLVRFTGLTASSKTAFTAYARMRVGSTVWESRKMAWTARAQEAKWDAEVKALQAGILRDKRDGKEAAARLKAEQIEYLQQAKKDKKFITELDYSMDPSAMNAFYHVKVADKIKIKVMESGSLTNADEPLGRIEIPMSDIIAAQDFNPFTKRHEYGLYQREIKLEESEGEDARAARMTIALRWVPCIEDPDSPQDDEEEEEQQLLLLAQAALGGDAANGPAAPAPAAGLRTSVSAKV